MTRFHQAVAALFIVQMFAGLGEAQTVATKPAVPLDPVTAVIDAFRTHALVALSDAHANEQLHAFRLALIRDPRFAAAVNDVVVEFGNPRYQEIIDRFIRGDSVPDDSLRQVWRNTTQPQASHLDSGIYEEFFRAIRAVNAGLPRERRLRVLLGDPPIDWSIVHDNADYASWLSMRETYPADLIWRRVLSANRKALLIWTFAHFQRAPIFTNYDPNGFGETLVSRLRSISGAEAFTIFPSVEKDLEGFQPGVSSWTIPSLTLLRGTTLGAVDYAKFWPPNVARVRVRNGSIQPVPPDEFKSMRLEDEFDALLYLGPPSAMKFAEMKPELCSDSTYMRQRLAKLEIAGPPPEIDRLKQFCHRR